MERVKQYLANAQECRAIAERAPSKEAKAHFTRMAETWETLARHRLAIIGNGQEPPKEDGGSNPSRTA